MYISVEGHFSNLAALKEAIWEYVPRCDRDQLLSWADDAFELHFDEFEDGSGKNKWEYEAL
jgi:hypothetical protein